MPFGPTQQRPLYSAIGPYVPAAKSLARPCPPPLGERTMQSAGRPFPSLQKHIPAQQFALATLGPLKDTAVPATKEKKTPPGWEAEQWQSAADAWVQFFWKMLKSRAASTLRKHLSGWPLWAEFCTGYDIHVGKPQALHLLQVLDGLPGKGHRSSPPCALWVASSVGNCYWESQALRHFAWCPKTSGTHKEALPLPLRCVAALERYLLLALKIWMGAYCNRNFPHDALVWIKILWHTAWLCKLH